MEMTGQMLQSPCAKPTDQAAVKRGYIYWQDTNDRATNTIYPRLKRTKVISHVLIFKLLEYAKTLA